MMEMNDFQSTYNSESNIELKCCNDCSILFDCDRTLQKNYRIACNLYQLISNDQIKTFLKEWNLLTTNNNHNSAICTPNFDIILNKWHSKQKSETILMCAIRKQLDLKVIDLIINHPVKLITYFIFYCFFWYFGNTLEIF